MELFDSPWQVAASGLIGLVTAICTYMGTRYRARHELKLQQQRDAIEHEKIDAEAYAEGRNIWESIIEDLRTQVRDYRAELIELRQQMTLDRAELTQLRQRLEDLEAEQRAGRRALRAVVEYARQLIALLKANGITPPSPPSELSVEDTNPGGLPAIPPAS